MLAGIAVVAGAVAVAAVAIAGIATAAEVDPADHPVATVDTIAPAESLPPSDGSEGGEGAAAEGEAPTDPGHSLPAEGIECPGTGDGRSAEVALVPRCLAHSRHLSGAERGAAISEWAKTHANRKAEEAGGEPVVDEGGASGDAVVVPSTSDQTSPASPGRSGDAPGRSGDAPGRSDSQPGPGRGR